MRRGEILSLRYLDVDLVHGCILLPQTKNGEGRIVPLNAWAQRVLTALPSGSATQRLFTVKPAHVTVAFERACKRAGIEDFSLHDCRHTTASWLAMLGKDIYTIAQVLGHKDLRMSARYAHLSPAYLGDAVKVLDAVFDLPHSQSVPAPIALIEGETVSA
jgi:integrase